MTSLERRPFKLRLCSPASRPRCARPCGRRLDPPLRAGPWWASAAARSLSISYLSIRFWTDVRTATHFCGSRLMLRVGHDALISLKQTSERSRVASAVCDDGVDKPSQFARHRATAISQLNVVGVPVEAPNTSERGVGFTRSGTPPPPLLHRTRTTRKPDSFGGPARPDSGDRRALSRLCVRAASLRILRDLVRCVCSLPLNRS
jgi:hypothetical protein